MFNFYDDSDLMESAVKSMARKRVTKIDRIEAQGIRLKLDAYLESLAFHWWDKDDPYWYWDIR